MNVFNRTIVSLQYLFEEPPSRKRAWYFSTLAVDPSLQGKGYGSLLLRRGLEIVDQDNSPTWLVGLEELEKYYNRFGFVEKARANVGELERWVGGSIMFRE